MEGDIEESKKSVSVAETNSKDDHKDTNEESVVSAPAANDDDETGFSDAKDTNNDGISQTNDTNAVAPVAAASPPPPQWAQMPYAVPVVPTSQQYAPPQYFPYPPPHPYCYYYDPTPYHHEPSPSQPVGDGVGWSSNYGGNRSIWVGDLEEWMEENYLLDCFAHTGEVSSVKVIRNRLSGRHMGYGFVEFVSQGAAERALWSYPWMRMPSTNQPFRVNWAMFSATNNKLSNNKKNNYNGDGDGPDHSIFVGDLASDVTDSLLHGTFSAKYPSAKAAKVVIDPNTGRSKGYGFVRFGDETEMSKAMSEMEGIYCSTRPMRIGIATQQKKSSHYNNSSAIKPESSSGAAASSHSEGDSANTTIFVGGLDPEVSGEDLKQPFAQYGEIVSVKIPKGKGCGFVQFVNRSDAEKALQELNSTTIGKRTVRLAWGHSLSNKQSIENGFGHGWTTGAYNYGGPYYDGYGYPMHYHFM